MLTAGLPTEKNLRAAAAENKRTILRMAEFMRDRRATFGACTVDDLACEGFTTTEILECKDEAIAEATRLDMQSSHPLPLNARVMLPRGTGTIVARAHKRHTYRVLFDADVPRPGITIRSSEECFVAPSDAIEGSTLHHAA